MSNREHLGVSAENEYCDVTDPVDVKFYKHVWLKQASINTTIYDKVRLSIVNIHHLFVSHSTKCMRIRNKCEMKM